MRAIAVFAATTIGLVVALPTATASEPSELGWWWAGYATDPMLEFQPVPPVPDGGFYVAGDVTGPSGISAMRFELQAGERPHRLEIMVSESVGSPVIDACIVSEPWEAVEGGTWDQRPQADCEAARISGMAADDGASIIFEVGSIGGAGVLDLVLVPGTEPSTGAPATFAASFDPPDSGTLAIRQTPVPDDNSGDPPPSRDDAMPGEQPDAPAPAASTPAPAVRAAPVPRVAGPIEPSPKAGGPLEPLVAPPPSTRVNASPSVPVLQAGFAYPAVLALPLLMLCLGSYLAWALTRPVRVRASG